MAKLTRTQKYAQLRENLSNEKENTLTTNDLSVHEDRLNNVIETLAPSNIEKVIEVPSSVEVASENIENITTNNPNYSWTSFQEVPVVDEIKEVEELKEEPSIIHETIVEPHVVEVESAPIEEVSISEIQEPILSSDYLSYFSNPEIEKAYAEQEAKEASQDVVEQIHEEEEKIFVPIEESIQTVDTNVSEVKETVNEIAEFVDEVDDNKVEIIETKPVDLQDSHEIERRDEVPNEFINDTISEVDEYNRQGGHKTIDELTNHMVDEIRHPDEAKENVFTEVPVPNFNINDDDFSNTVSLEITKIMDEISNIETVPVEDIKEEVVDEVVNEAIEEHPVLTQALDQEEAVEEVVEIKNLNELEADPIKDTVSGTIPFVVSNNEDEDIIDDDEDEEENSNTILNVILVVLIIVLLAVLGLIIFYILKTRGII